MHKVDLSLVEKNLAKIPAYIRGKLFRWAITVEEQGIEFTRKIPGYHDEPLKGERQGSRSIRLNKSFRAIYVEMDEKEVKVIIIQEVNKHEY